MAGETAKVVRLADYRPPAFLVERVFLDFDLDPKETVVRSRLELHRNPEGDPKAPLWLDGVDLQLRWLKLNGRPFSDYEQHREGLLIPDPPERLELETEVAISPEKNTALEGLYLSKKILCTQCEAEGFRRITYFPDRPDILARYEVVLRADRDRFPILLSNGNPVERGLLEGGRHFVRWRDPFPKPSYLFALVAGYLARIEDRFTTCSGREVQLHLYLEPENVDKGRYALACLKEAMAWDEVRYGREYDLDLYQIVAVSHFNMGAMENKGLNLFNARYLLASPETATDQDFQNILAVIGHEYFHNWTGNRITLRDWFQLGLKEGLTTFREQQFCEERFSPIVRIETVDLLKKRQFPEDEGPLAHPVRPLQYRKIDNFYTATVYQKGAEIFRLLENLLGPDTFRRAMERYFERFDGKAVTWEDLFRVCEEVCGQDLDRAFRWITQAGTPKVTVDLEREGEALLFKCRQQIEPTPGQPEKEPLPIPIRTAIFSKEGEKRPFRFGGEEVEEVVLTLTGWEETFRLEGIGEGALPSLLRGFSAPVKLQVWRPLEDWIRLWRFDDDPVNRWEAGQRAAAEIILKRGGIPSASWLEAFGEKLRKPGSDRLLAALLLELPDFEALTQYQTRIEVETSLAGRERLAKGIATAFQIELLKAYRDHHRPERWRELTPEAMGERRLKNLALRYLAYRQDRLFQLLAAAQYHNSRGLNDRLAALEVIVHHNHPERDLFLEDFYRRYGRDDLIVDRWFAVQASDPSQAAFERIKRLTEHPRFDLKNPNRVRALLAVFSQNNPHQFHRRTGEGYAFLANWIIRIDRLNPHLSSRLLQPLTRWPRFDPFRAERMRRELERIRASKPSEMVQELVEKALDQV